MSVPPDLIEQARAVTLDAVVVVCGVKLRRVGRELIGACVACGGVDRFSVHPGRGVFNCRGCGAKGDAIALAMHLHGVDFRAAVEMLTGALPAQNRRKPAQAPGKAAERDDTAALARADAIWRAAVPIAGTPGEAYLTGRGIALDEAPNHAGLRFHPACHYGR